MTASIRASLVASLSLALMTAGAGRPLAQETTPPPPPVAVGGSVGYFGEHGQVAVSTDLQFNIVRTSYNTVGGMSPASTTEYLIQPAVDYFASTNVSLGGALTLQKQGFGPGAGDVTTVGFAVRAGYNVVLTNALSLWIRGGFAYNRLSYSGALDGSGYAIPFFLYAPVLWHPVSHFFVGLGPVLDTELVSQFEGNDNFKRTQFGLQSTVGGYFGGL